MYNKYLKTFIEVADYGSFKKTSEHLYISSVGVQKQIKKKKKELDLKLFERTNQGVELTYAGQRIYNDSKKIIEYCENEIKSIKESENYCFKIANCMIKSSDEINDCLIKNCKEKYIMIPFVLVGKNGFNDMKEEIKREFDAFIFAKFVDCFMKEVNYNFLCTTTLKLAVSKENELYRKRKISYSDLENKEICFFRSGLLEEYDSIKENMIRNISGLKVIDYDLEKLSFTDSLSVMSKYPCVTIDGIDFLMSNSKSIPFTFDTNISVGLYTKKNFLDR